MSYAYGVGAALTCLGSKLGFDWLSNKTVTGRASDNDEVLLYTIGIGCAIATLETVKGYVVNSSPFWKGVSDCIPVSCMLTGQLFGRAGVIDRLARENKLEVVKSELFKNSLNDWEGYGVMGVAGLFFFSGVVPRELTKMIAAGVGIMVGAGQATEALLRVADSENR